MEGPLQVVKGAQGGVVVVVVGVMVEGVARHREALGEDMGPQYHRLRKIFIML